MAEPVSTTVITPAVSRSLISLENLRIDLGTAASADDEFLERAIARASTVAETYCGRVFAAETVEDRFCCGPYGALWLSRSPVIEIVSITNDGEAVDASSYHLDRAIGRIVPLSFSWGSEVLVRYEAGYAEIPLDIQGAVGEIVKALQFNRTRDPLLRSENILSGLYAYTLFDANASPAGTAQQVAAILDSYRTVSL